MAKELETRDFIQETSEGRFWLGIEVLKLGGSYISQSEYTEAARRVLQKLSNETGETVNMGTLRGAEVLYLEKWEGANSVVTVSHVGKQIPANCTAMGKVLLARLMDEEVEARFKGTYPTLTSASLGSYATLVADLDTIRVRGYAVDLGETLDGRACVSIALESSLASAEDGVAVSISMAMHRYE
ncbi:MAG: IclR family transcriptional regulator C-terminal domain-containing protein, partial [Acidimicrobiia bacterium]